LTIIVVVENLSLFEVASTVKSETSLTIPSLLDHVSSPVILSNVIVFVFAPDLNCPVVASTVALP